MIEVKKNLIKRNIVWINDDLSHILQWKMYFYFNLISLVETIELKKKKSLMWRKPMWILE